MGDIQHGSMPAVVAAAVVAGDGSWFLVANPGIEHRARRYLQLGSFSDR
jgi:hypothetical protein